MQISSLRCEFQKEPLGIGVGQPRLSWKLESSEGCFDERQTAYRIWAASSAEKLARGEADLWDSGLVESAQTHGLAYGGEPQSHRRVFWKVQVRDQAGTLMESETAHFSFGLLEVESEWKAEFIRFHWNPHTPLMRKPFRIEKPVKRAVLYSTALGVYEMRLNGAKVGCDRLAPGWTDYHKTLYYQTYEVTDQLCEGENVLGGIVGAGWYAGFFGPFEDKGYWGREAFLSAQLHLFYEDGSEERVVTDSSWKGHAGPILRADLLMGEEVDARKELPGWDAPGFKEQGGWAPVRRREAALKAELRAQPAPTVQELCELPARSVSEPKAGLYVFDLGQNLVGHIRLKVVAPVGTKLTIRHGEMLRDDGTVYTENLRSAKATDVYICRGGGVEEWAPRFTFHGFRYVEVEGWEPQNKEQGISNCEVDSGTLNSEGDTPRQPTPSNQQLSVSGVVLMSALEPVGKFECSDARVNQLFSNVVWGMRGNYLEVPTDCPQRDERLGWTGDTHMFARTATGLYDIAAFMSKYLKELYDAQRSDGAFRDCAPYMGFIEGGHAAWDDAGVIIPYVLWQVYGEVSVIEEAWPHMERFMEFLTLPGNTHNSEKAITYGDWLNINEETSHRCLGVAYHAYDAKLMAEMAEATGRTAAARKYWTRFEDVKAQFNALFVKEDGRIDNDTQTAYVLALQFGLLDEARTEQAARHLIANLEANNGYLKTGFVGTSYLALALTKIGRADMAYTLLLNDGYPSWLYEVKNGATTIWERWNSWTKEDGFGDISMNSFNHYAFGAIAEWMFRHMAGIDLKMPGFGEVRIAPQIDERMDFVRAEYDAVSGRIVSQWKRDENGVTLEVEIPPNTMAEIVLPNGDVKEVGSGKHRFETTKEEFEQNDLRRMMSALRG